MDLKENFSLKKYNTFGIDATARYFSSFKNLDELEEICSSPLFSQGKRLVLGGGSNILLTGDFDGIAAKNDLTGITALREDDQHVWLRACAGENWHSFVTYCIDHDLGGIENLSLIPGNVGASPMQNIGAYGVEVKDVVEEVEAYSIYDKCLVNFSNSECRFGYRDSIFKQEAKGRFVITSVTFRLDKLHNFNTAYGAIGQELEQMGVKELSIRAVSQAVINIRKSKLPDPADIGNAGSFFKNPVIEIAHYNDLKLQYPEIPGYEQEGGIKVPAGWLIEQQGWKGKRFGDAGVHAKQALVLVNYGNAKGEEILELSEKIMQSVNSAYGIALEREVNII